MNIPSTNMPDALRSFLAISKTPAWSEGSFRLDEALEAAREALSDYEEQQASMAQEKLGALDEGTSQILVFSDGDTWESFDPGKHRVVTVTSEGFDDLCEGYSFGQFDSDQIIRDQTLAEVINAQPSQGSAAEMVLLAERAGLDVACDEQDGKNIWGWGDEHGNGDTGFDSDFDAALDGLENKYRETWVYEVMNRDTRRGFTEYVNAELVAAEIDEEMAMGPRP